jgi:hypothetical protein
MIEASHTSMRVVAPALLSALALGYAGASLAAPVPTMTVVIINNSCKAGTCPAGQTAKNIYPVISMGPSGKDLYMRAIMNVPQNNTTALFPLTSQMRFYVNPTGNGVPPGGTVTLTLPFYTQLVDPPDPTQPNQYANWWNGGRIEIFDSEASTGAPSAALTAAFNAEKTVVTPVGGAAVPTFTCSFSPCQPLKFFSNVAGLTNNEPSQLTEYTLGALGGQPDQSKPQPIDLHTVDYDLSFVDATYMPAAMEPFNNSQVGYIGTPLAIDPFRAIVSKFLAAYPGWPQFKDNQGLVIVKAPSLINILGPYAAHPTTPRTDYSPSNPPWAPITALFDQWTACANGGSGAICPDVVAVRNLILANYKWCTGAQAPASAELLIMDHAYGWTPFNTDPNKPETPVACPNNTPRSPNNQPASHLLQDTPGYWVASRIPTQPDYSKYQAAKDQFDTLQYWPGIANPNGLFDPYLLLIHGKDYINTAYAYAYSVDDALGNMLVKGDGFYIAVGGTAGLPNGLPATPPINVAMGYNSTTPNWVNFTKYGVCSDTPDQDVIPTFASFPISATSPQTCPLSFLDAAGNIYKITLKQPPVGPPPGNVQNYPSGPPAPNVPVGQQYFNPALIDCSGNAANTQQSAWCRYPPVDTPTAYGAEVWSTQGLLGGKTNTNTLNLRSACQPSQKPGC